MISSIRVGAELLRRRPDGSWPERPEAIGPGDPLQLDSIGYAAPLVAACATTVLARG